MFMLDWLESAELRRRCHAGLNKGESRHALDQAVFLHKQGRLVDRTFENQTYRASGLNLVTAAIVYWNTIYLGRAADHLRSTGERRSRRTPATCGAARLEPHQPDRRLSLEPRSASPDERLPPPQHPGRRGVIQRTFMIRPK